jgi:hypothetical protein
VVLPLRSLILTEPGTAEVTTPRTDRVTTKLPPALPGPFIVGAFIEPLPWEKTAAGMIKSPHRSKYLIECFMLKFLQIVMMRNDF